MEISSRNVVEGPSRAPHRAMYKAMGLSDDDLGKPFVGVSHTGNEATPCNINLGKLSQHAKHGVSDAGGTPREFATIAVSDGIAMGHEGMKASLVSREIIADSIEVMVRAHQYDGLVGLSENAGLGLDLAGSRHYRRICINGVELTESCRDFREEICNTGISQETLML